ncbi:signal transduction histidine kinase [Rhizobium sp. BK538]|nr:signal transduction histidine kinase [Rhizobium sp. BK060]MBB4171585.1 signal transduction histidine kinase [Rhizobium sp. BK538]TCM71152.1 hypothetical protein EV291_1234 [Rhizobium sp. BK068]
MLLIDDAYTEVAEDNDQTLTVEECVPTLVQGDRELLIQMVVNIVENAITHCPPKTKTKINVSLRWEHNFAVVSIADTGTRYSFR